ncbi:hypothetical protein D9758_018023 [Tetrapyrgos nigripes]|uniref:Uncharacterized protein n=1 Tax=Tetrapyrgos nigripes TaxID=182062 RepID=A0A8H5BR62_9AGAR|nr:hypothetical protein D9758_018023 [Tetrapyrgos nigripes]
MLLGKDIAWEVWLSSPPGCGAFQRKTQIGRLGSHLRVDIAVNFQGLLALKAKRERAWVKDKGTKIGKVDEVVEKGDDEENEKHTARLSGTTGENLQQHLPGYDFYLLVPSSSPAVCFSDYRSDTSTIHQANARNTENLDIDRQLTTLLSIRASGIRFVMTDLGGDSVLV